MSEQNQMTEQLRVTARVFSHMREAVVITDALGTILEINAAFTAIAGYTREDVLGKTPRLLRSDSHNPAFYAAMWQELLTQGYWSGEIWNRNKRGEIYPARLTISALYDTQGWAHRYIGLFSDLQVQKSYEQHLEHVAYHDALTGLPNRVLLSDRLLQGMAQVERRGQCLALIYLDLDEFKAVNDTHGHDVGDRLLIALAHRLGRVMRQGDTLARLGGDEFIAVLMDLDDEEESAPLLGRLLDAASQPVQLGEAVLRVSASLGVTHYPQAKDVNADQLIRQADQAMYQAKLAGKNRFHYFDVEQAFNLRGRHEDVECIRQGFQCREFVLFYQPKVNMRTGEVVGAEALIRWQHPERGLLPPIQFLPAIEEHPLALELGAWVIASALEQLSAWHAQGLAISVSVNVSACQLRQDDFVEQLMALLAMHPDLPAGALEFEIVESSALHDVGKVSKLMRQCRALGVDFALDDFGTGYSSLTYLKRLPAATLKIDQTFVRDMLQDPDDLSILEAVLGLAMAFQRQTIAEGVETLEQGRLLLQLGCELAQGYGIARPMPAGAFPAWAAQWQPHVSWTTERPVSRYDLPIVFARVEHTAWILAIDDFLRHGLGSLPAVHHHDCRFGRWLHGEGELRHGAKPVFGPLKDEHERLHAHAARLLVHKEQGQDQEVVHGLVELHALAGALGERLAGLMGKDIGERPCAC